MRAIDENGRLFGKVNVIDFLVILFLICLTPMLYFGYKLFHRPVVSSTTIPRLVSLDFYLKIDDLEPNDLRLISVGDVFIDEAGNNVGEVLSVSEPSIYSYNVDLGSGNIISRQDPSRRQVLVKARIPGEIKENSFYFNGEKIAIGSKIKIKTTKYNVEGGVESEPKSAYTRMELVELNINFKPLEPNELKLISVGDVFIDEAGNNVGEILSVGEPSIYSYNIDLGSGNIISRQDPSRRQVLVKMKILGEIKNNLLYYHGEKINIGSKINIKTTKYNVEGGVESEPKSAYTRMELAKSAYTHMELIELNINFKPLEPNDLKLISVSDIFIDEAGNNVGEILSVSEPGIYSYNVDLGSGNIISRQDPSRRQVLVKARITGEIKDNAFYYNGEKMSIGSKINIKTTKYKVEGIVESEPKSMLQEKVLLKVKFTNLIPEVAELTNIGDENKDESGSLLGQIKSIISNKPSELMVHKDGAMIVVSHPVNRDVVLLIEAISAKVGDKLFFGKTEVKVGKDISFSTNKYDITGIIISVIKD